MNETYAIVTKTWNGHVSILKDLSRELCIETCRTLNPRDNPWPFEAICHALQNTGCEQFGHSEPCDFEMVTIVGPEIPKSEIWPKPENFAQMIADFEDKMRREADWRQKVVEAARISQEESDKVARRLNEMALPAGATVRERGFCQKTADLFRS